jgi:hypothetical protein
MATPIKLQGAQVLEISPIEHNLPFAANTNKGKAGKTYSRFRYDGILFTVDTDNPFVADFIAGNVKTAKLMDTEREVVTKDVNGDESKENVRSIDFDSYISRAQWKALQQDDVDDAKVAFQIGRLKQLETAPVTEDLLAQLANNA